MVFNMCNIQSLDITFPLLFSFSHLIKHEKHMFRKLVLEKLFTFIVQLYYHLDCLMMNNIALMLRFFNNRTKLLQSWTGIQDENCHMFLPRQLHKLNWTARFLLIGNLHFHMLFLVFSIVDFSLLSFLCYTYTAIVVINFSCIIISIELDKYAYNSNLLYFSRLMSSYICTM